MADSIIPQTITHLPVSSLNNANVLDIAPHAKPGCYRLVHCTELVERDTLQIDEFPGSLDQVKYSTLSYVWRGSAPDAANPSPSFSVKGAEDADPINIAVVRHAAIASIRLGMHYLWMDRLCIIQTSRDDKNWQIANMYRVYQGCAVAIILPGGVQRLVRLDEDTDWMHRGWTLQEALAPPLAVVLFSWRFGMGEMRSGEGGVDSALGKVRNAVPGESAMAPLANILNACITGYTSFIGSSSRCATQGPLKIKARVLGAASANATALAIALTPELQDPDFAPGNQQESDPRNHAIWQSALLRTSSRPVDMVFSIMGLFGVSLDTKAFHKDDRLGVTIALAREILKRGGRATWMGVSFTVPRSPFISTFPAFPQTSVAGRALFDHDGDTVEISTLIEAVESPNAFATQMMRLPGGTMDEHGRMSFVRKAKRLFPMSREAYLRERNENKISRRGENSEQSPCVAMDGSIWRIAGDQETEEESDLEVAVPKAYAVLLGWYDEYHPGVTPAHDSFQLKAMLIVESMPDQHYIVSFFKWSMWLQKWPLTWPERTFHVGRVPIHHTKAVFPSNFVTDEDVESSFDPRRRQFHRLRTQLTLAAEAIFRMAKAGTQAEQEAEFARVPTKAQVEAEKIMPEEQGWRPLGLHANLDDDDLDEHDFE